MKLLIIGGTGFFGKSFLDSFKRGLLNKYNINEIIIIARNISKFKKKFPELLDPKIKYIKGNITTINSLPEVDYIIHAATSTDKNNYIENPNKEFLNIKLGIRNFTKLVKSINIKSKILYCSSGAVYGKQPGNIIRIKESHPFSNLNTLSKEKRIYSKGKRIAEMELKKITEFGLNVVIARCFTFKGKYLPKDQHFAYGNFISRAEMGKKILVKTKKKVYRSYMSADNLVKSLITLLINADRSLQIYNLGSSKMILIHNLAKKIAKIYNVDVSYKIDINADIDRYVPCTKKLKKVVYL